MRAEFGPRAEIVGAERVTVGGIRGFFAREHYEITVLIPEDGYELTDRHLIGLSERAGIAALLDDADREEALGQLAAAPEPDRVSTASAMFDEILGSLDFSEPVPVSVPVSPAGPAHLAAPAVCREPGDLILVLGLPQHPLAVAQSMALLVQGAVFVAGQSVDTEPLAARRGMVRLEDRRTAMAARALGVRRAQASFVALGTDLQALARRPEDLRDLVGALAPDQVWAVVDATRKSEDTAGWLARVAGFTTVDALAVIGSEHTTTPETVNMLGVPVGWVERPSVG